MVSIKNEVEMRGNRRDKFDEVGPQVIFVYALCGPP